MNSRHEVYGSFGLLTIQDLDATPLVICIIGSCGTGDVARITGGAIGVGYNYHVTPRFTLGFQGNYQRFIQTWHDPDGAVSTADLRYFTLMARADFRWINDSSFQLYSGFALGGTKKSVSSQGNSDNLPASAAFTTFQLNALGMRFGSSFGFFLELGVGANGLLSGGLSGRF